jgi:uncharacterized membrane protein
MTENLPERPIFRGDPADWHRNILAYGPLEIPAVTSEAVAIATAVFYAAANWSEMFRSPLKIQLYMWAHLFEDFTDWLTIDLAERAVHAHFRQSITGHMLPAHVINGAAILKLEVP